MFYKVEEVLVIKVNLE